MKQAYMKGLLAGVAGGIAISAILVLQVAVSMLVIPYLFSGSSPVPEPGMAVVFPMLISFLSYGLYGVVLLFTGALSVWLARELLSEYSESLIVSGISGVVASILWIVTNALIAVINGLFLFPSVLESSASVGQTELGLLGMVVAMDVCCCGPVFLVVATTLTLIGGGICGLIVVKK